MITFFSIFKVFEYIVDIGINTKLKKVIYGVR